MLQIKLENVMIFLIVNYQLIAINCTSNDLEIDEEWWRDEVIYQINIPSFLDSNADGIGDLKGVGLKLNYLYTTGIKVILLNPFYQLIDFKSIQTEYGTMNDFTELIQKAKEFDIKVLMDLIPFYTSWQNKWFQQSINRNSYYNEFYIWSDIKNVTANSTDWFWHERRQQYYLYYRNREQPILNYRNVKVRQTMKNILRFWLNNNIYGFRLIAPHKQFELEIFQMLYNWHHILTDYKNYYGGSKRLFLMEINTNLTTKHLMECYKNSYGYKGCDIPLNRCLIDDLNAVSADAHDFVFTINKWLIYMPRKQTANWLLGNYDTQRLSTNFGSGKSLALTIMLMSLPGIAITYNGEEIGMKDNKGYLSPYQWNNQTNAGFSNASKTWLPLHPNYKTVNLERQLQTNKSHYHIYKTLIQLRSKLKVLKAGDSHVTALSKAVFVIKRSLKGHPSLITLINIYNKQQSIQLMEIAHEMEIWKVLLSSKNSKYNEGDLIATNTTMTLMPYEGIICQQKQQTRLEERRLLLKTFLNSLNIILVGLLLYKLWNNKWKKLNFQIE